MPLEKKYRELFNTTEVEDYLALRVIRFKVNIKDLFLVVKIPDDFYELEYDLETYFGKLKVFFSKDPDLKATLLLHKDKFNYPTPGFLSSLKNMPLQKTQMEDEITEAQALKKMEEEEFGSSGINIPSIN